MNDARIDAKRFVRLFWPVFVLIVMTLVIMIERMGVQIEGSTFSKDTIEKRIYNVSDSDFSDPVEGEVECLVLIDESSEQSQALYKSAKLVLDDMRVSYDVWDINEKDIPDWNQYKTMVVTSSNLEVLGDNIVTLCDWIYSGGRMMTTGTFEAGGYGQILFSKFGILNSASPEYTYISGMRIVSDKILNGNNFLFRYDEPMLTSLSVALDKSCEVFITDIDKNVPLLWKAKYGDGCIVVNNQVLLDKANRGILCSAYSLLPDVSVYPVINASSYYIDDFPSPVPEGDGEFIKRDYNVDINNFYANTWWPDIIDLEKDYGIVHTGLIIEDYNDVVKAPFYNNEAISRFSFFGNMLLNNSGEIGIHGYNHMPLVLDNYDYKDQYDSYNKWPSFDDMVEATRTVYNFGKKIFPDHKLAVYVPPSNILSKEGREALKVGNPDLRIIASTYFDDDIAYGQEFEVAEDGIIETPRITSGEDFDAYMMLLAFSELNFHYVQSHFLHPDDTLDEDRGAELGWANMYANLREYIEYINSSAPFIRQLSGSGMGEAVREFDKLTVRTEEEKNAKIIHLGGFYKDAFLMLRANDRQIKSINGGTLDEVANGLYLLHAIRDEVVIKYEEE